jgi:type I restriction enzyme S subunit
MAAQLSSLPVGWVETNLGEVCNKPTQRKPMDTELFHYIDIGSINRKTKTIENPELIAGDKAPSRARKLVDKGDVLVSMTRPNLNAVAKVEDKLAGNIASTGFEVLKPILVEPDLIFAIVKSKKFIQAISGITQGALYPACKSTDIRGFEIGLPPIDEQKRIVAKLDQLLTQVESIQSRLDKLPGIIKRFRQAVLAAAVSGKLTEDWRGESEWSYKPMGVLPISIQIGPFGSLLHKSDYIEDGISLINPMHIINGIIKPSTSMTVSLDKSKELGRYLLQKGDIVLGRRGEMGRAAVVSHDSYICGTGSVFLRPSNQHFKAQFIAIYLRSPSTISVLEKGAVGSTMANLNQKILKELPFPDIELSEQTEIVRLVEQHFALADTLEKHLKNAKIRVDNLTQSILAKAFKGELVPQDPNDEPADQLLARIQAARVAAEALTKAAKKATKSRKK